jgi:hypothetical protein
VRGIGVRGRGDDPHGGLPARLRPILNDALPYRRFYRLGGIGPVTYNTLIWKMTRPVDVPARAGWAAVPDLR